MQAASVQHQGNTAGRSRSNIDHGGSPIVLVVLGCKLH